MYRFYANQEQIGESDIRITGTDVNHIKNVLRMKIGDKLIISNGQRRDYHCIIDDVAKDVISLKIDKVEETNTELPCKITVFQAIPKKDKMEFMIQKAVELGVYEIVPIVTNRCVVKWDEGKVANRTKRWRSIAEAAAKQSARGIIPKVCQPTTWKEALERVDGYDMGLIPYELAEDEGVGRKESRAVLDEACGRESVCIFIGPEGGFEDEEVKEAIKAGLTMVSLGKRILRTETAAMAILSYMMMKMD